MDDWHDRDGDEAEGAERHESLPAPWERPDCGTDAAPPASTRHDAFSRAPARQFAFMCGWTGGGHGHCEHWEHSPRTDDHTGPTAHPWRLSELSGCHANP